MSLNNDTTVRDVFLLTAGFAVLVASLFIAVYWWRATIQRQVWERQGCRMTTFEVFMGAKPIQRNMIIESEGGGE